MQYSGCLHRLHIFLGERSFPGALLAVLVTCAALFALAVVIAVGPDGPVRLWLDGGGSSTNLRPGANGSAGALRRLPGRAGRPPPGRHDRRPDR